MGIRQDRGKLWTVDQYERSLIHHLLEEITWNIPNYPRTIPDISVSEWAEMFTYNTGHQLFELSPIVWARVAVTLVWGNTTDTVVNSS